MADESARLELLHGQEVAATFDIDQEATLGRGEENTITLPGAGASRCHARVYQSGPRYWVEDLMSTNGTMVNGERVTKQMLKNGDVIEIGERKLRFSGPEPEPQTIKDAAPVEATAIQQTINVQGYDPGKALADTGAEAQNERLLRHLRTLQDIGNDIGTILRPDALLQAILDHLFTTFPKADAGFVLLRDPENPGKLVRRASKSRDGEEDPKLAVSTTIIRQVIRKRQAVLTGDAQTDFGEVLSIKRHSMRSMVCVPLICRDEMLGVIHLHSAGQRGAFREEDLHLFTSIANQAAICVKNAELCAQVEHEAELRRDFQRYVSPKVAEHIVDKKIAVELGGQHCVGTVFFSDIVGFTAMSETREPGEVVSILNQYFQSMVSVIFRHEGAVNKFGGDAILAVWGAPLNTTDAEAKAMAAGLGMQNAMYPLTLQLLAQQELNLGMGIGINTGKFMAGNIGSNERMEYTIIGDAVNLAARIEAKATRGQVFASESTFQPAAAQVVAVQLPPTPMKGKSEPVVMYCIRGVQAVVPDSTDVSIPVLCSAPGADRIRGLITKATRRSESTYTLDMVCEPGLPEASSVLLEPALPESPGLPSFECTAAKQGDGLVIESPYHSLISLELQDASEETVRLFQPGNLFESPLESVEGMRG